MYSPWFYLKACLGLTPFKGFIPRFYIGKLKVGTPYFYPRKWVKQPDGSHKAVQLRVGFDSCGLGWKTKWEETDVRHEWNPVWSFVFFGLQVAVTFRPPNDSQYWESYILYQLFTEGSVRERVDYLKETFPNEWTNKWARGGVEKIDYLQKALKSKYR